MVRKMYEEMSILGILIVMTTIHGRYKSSIIALLLAITTADITNQSSLSEETNSKSEEKRQPGANV
jgi:hypothetical protein